MCHLNTVCNKKWSSSYSHQLSEGLLVKVSLSLITVVDNKVINLRYFPVFHFLSYRVTDLVSLFSVC